MSLLTQESSLSDSIRKSGYYFSQNTKQLFQVARLNKTAFHETGANLAICLLSLNRVQLTIKLLSSLEYYLEGFTGEVLIIDNNSAAEQKDKLKEYIATSPLTIRLLELTENLGVGKARNYAAAHTEKDWLMFLDNDMYFIKDPLPAIKKAIELLGVHFLNLPLINYDNKTIFALGGALFSYPTKEGFFLGGGSSFDFKRKVEFSDVRIEAPFLSDFVFGGASVLHRKSFIATGGFDKDMFVGFEDIDLSLRLYNAGIKIGNIDEFVLVHNHKPSANLNDVEAEKKRFNNEIIRSSAIVFEKKNGLVVYDQHTEEWLKKKQEDLINNAQAAPANGITKKRIALIVDTRDWAFHNIARNIEVQLGEKYDFTFYFQSDFKDEKWLDIYPILFHERHDIILFFWRPACKHIFSSLVSSYLEHECNISREAFEQFLNDTVLLTCVYDHLYLSAEDIKNNKSIFTNHIDGYIVSSNKLNGIYNNIEGYKKPYTVIQDGVDTKKFFRKETTTFSDPSQPLVVGWAGNSAWGIVEDGIDHKGFTSIIKPAVAELIAEGYPIRLVYADKQEPQTFFPASAMNEFYNSLDVYICASDIEGTPNPVLESMACGIAVISTDVGIVLEAFGREQKKFILEERTKECLKQKLITLIRDRTILATLGKENSARILHWTWENRCEKFDELFDYYSYKKSIKALHHKKFPYSAGLEKIAEAAAEQASEAASTNDPAKMVIDLNGYVLKRDLDEQYKEIVYWKQNAIVTRDWYHNEYEVLPLWFKRLGHIVKVLQGRRPLKSLFTNNVPNK